jgi:hypothetical protein
MRGGVRTYIYCQPPADGRIRSQGIIACLRQGFAFAPKVIIAQGVAPKVIKCAAYGVAIMNGRRDGFIT